MATNRATDPFDSPSRRLRSVIPSGRPAVESSSRIPRPRSRGRIVFLRRLFANAKHLYAYAHKKMFTAASIVSQDQHAQAIATRRTQGSSDSETGRHGRGRNSRLHATGRHRARPLSRRGHDADCLRAKPRIPDSDIWGFIQQSSLNRKSVCSASAGYRKSGPRADLNLCQQRAETSWHAAALIQRGRMPRDD